MNPVDLAWAAGFLDGEGCFTLSKMPSMTHASQRALVVSACQVRVEALIRLRDIVERGNITRLGTTKAGSEIWQWRIGSAVDVNEVVPRLLPYLFLKKREAEIVLAFAQTVRRRGRPKAGVVNFTSAEEVAARLALIEELEGIRNGARAVV